ncbi:MAG: hypothetical protein GXO11_06910 [Epsilonproteobacteria bacterium]|nr:hypothetical protein [Campylobacterota bacterium]
MVQRIFIFTVLFLGVFALTGCSTKKVQTFEIKQQADMQHPSKKEMLTLLKEAAQKQGWRVTSFKENSIILEKEEGGVTTSGVATIAHDTVIFTNLDENNLGDFSDIEEEFTSLLQENK